MDLKSKIAALMNSLGNDKKNHVIAFTLAYLVLVPFIGIWALLVVSLGAAAVEVIDLVGKNGEPSVLDFIASVAFPLIHTFLTLISTL